MAIKTSEYQKKQTILKYLGDLAGRFEELRLGIESNSFLWTSFCITPESINVHTDELYETGIEIERLKEKLSAKLAEARMLRESKKKIIEQFEKRAIGLHADSESKLKDYGINF